MADADLHFYFDPVCPFAWMTSKWVRTVAERKSYAVEWRFISLRLLNAHLDYDTHFPPEYEASHTAGLKLLRVAARIRADHGPEPIATYYRVVGEQNFEHETRPEGGTRAIATAALAACGLPAEYADALDGTDLDAVIQAETDHALSLTGKDVGTPILHFEPPAGSALFGPVISRLPGDDEAVELWDHVVALSRFPGFAELKRSLREQPQLPSFGVRPGDIGVREDWHGGSRRQKK